MHALEASASDDGYRHVLKQSPESLEHLRYRGVEALSESVVEVKKYSTRALHR